MPLWIERSYPFVLAILAGAVYYFFPVELPEEDVKDLLSASIGFGSVTAGFLATAISILMALPSGSVMGRIKSSSYINDLVWYLKEAFYSSLSFSLASLVSFFFIHSFNVWVTVFWVAIVAHVFLSLFRVADLMLSILRKP